MIILPARARGHAPQVSRCEQFCTDLSLDWAYHYRSFTILIRINVTGTGFAVCEGRHVKMPAHHRRMAIALMTRWFEHVQVGGAFNDTIFAIFSEDSPLGRFADGEVISFDEDTLYELADRDYGLDVWALLPSHAAYEIIENAVHGNSPMDAGTAAIAAIKGLYARAHQIAGANRQAFRRSPKTPSRNKDGRRTEPLETSSRQADCRNLPREASSPNNR